MGAPEAGVLIIVAVFVAVPSLLAYLDLRRSGQGAKSWFIVVAFVICWPVAFMLWFYWHTHAARANGPSRVPR